MTNEEQKNKLYQIYATIGELSVHKKQSEQRLSLINSEIEKFEAQLAEVLKTPIEAEKAPTEESKDE